MFTEVVKNRNLIFSNESRAYYGNSVVTDEDTVPTVEGMTS